MTYKVFVKYHSGTGGQFLTTLLLSLMKPLNIHDQTITSIHAPHIEDLRHNFHLVFPRFIYNKQTTVDLFTPDENGNVKAEKLMERFKFKFSDTDLPSYIIPTHWQDVYKMAPYIKNSKFIHIWLNENDIDQIAYNIVYKVWGSPSTQLDNVLFFIKICSNSTDILKRNNITLADVDLSNIDTKRVITWITKYHIKKYATSTFGVVPDNILNTNMRVNFRDIHNGNIVNQLDELAAFIGIEHLSDERRNNAIELINKYVAGQKDIPWKLSIDDY